LAEAARAAKGPLLVAEVGRDERYGSGMLARSGKVKSAVAVALRGRDKEQGVLLVDSGQALGPPELKLLATLADLAALRLEDVERLEKVRARDREKWRLQRFLPPARLPDALGGQVPALRPEGHPVESTLVYAKLKGVGALVERMGPKEVMSGLNTLWGELSRAVAEQCGCIERIQGEGMMALWSPEITGPGDATQALAAALRLAELAPKLELGGKPLAIRVGVHSGPVVLGLTGPEGRKDWAAIGPPVRLAAKLCAMALEGQVLCSQATVTRAGVGMPVKPIPLQTVEGFGPGAPMAYLVGAAKAEELSLDL
jgi:adenylate cyclase